jgi:hypothetical protein
MRFTQYASGWCRAGKRPPGEVEEARAAVIASSAALARRLAQADGTDLADHHAAAGDRDGGEFIRHGGPEQA